MKIRIKKENLPFEMKLPRMLPCIIFSINLFKNNFEPISSMKMLLICSDIFIRLSTFFCVSCCSIISADLFFNSFSVFYLNCIACIVAVDIPVFTPNLLALLAASSELSSSDSELVPEESICWGFCYYLVMTSSFFASSRA